jgi:hypothetical protein
VPSVRGMRSAVIGWPSHAGSPVCAVVRVLAGNRGMGMVLAWMYMVWQTHGTYIRTYIHVYTPVIQHSWSVVRRRP